MQQNEFLANDPLAALKLTPMALQGGSGGAINKGDPLMDMAKTIGTSYITGLPMFGAYNGTTSVPQNYMDGTEEVPGQRTGQDTVPAMLSPGEAVIPASAAQDPANQGAIEGMVEEGRQDQGVAAQILQSLGLPLEPQLIAMIEDMLAQGVPPEQIVQQLQERIGQSQGGQEMSQATPMAPQEAPMAPPMAPQGAPMSPMEQGAGVPQGLYGGTQGVQGPLAGKRQREQQKFDADEYRKDAVFQADQRRKDETHMLGMTQKQQGA